MLFQSQIFLLVFMPIVLGLYHLAARRAVLREWLLIAASLVFYGWWDPRFLPLIAGQALASWALAYLARESYAVHLVRLGILANLAILGIFKYFNFFSDTIASLTGAELDRISVVLPIGISFYTFQIVSYLADLRRGRAPLYSMRRFLLYILLFPQLIAGPIVRHNEIMGQFDGNPHGPGAAEAFARGAVLFVIGLAKKVLLADPLAAMADPVFQTATTAAPAFGAAWLGLAAFTLQIFLDFSAYSEMAIGLGRMMGLRFPDNFDQPYRSLSVREFWRRWHMTLSRFLRDYLYVPLGGSREGTRRYLVATFTTMGLCGLWHGAGWTYVVWGLYHGAGLVVCRGWEARGRTLPKLVAWGLTLVFVMFGWVLFRAADFSAVVTMLTGLAGLGSAAVAVEGATLLVPAALVSLVGVSPQAMVERWLKPHPVFAVATAAVFVYCVLVVGKGQPVSFIYFQF